MKRIIVAIGATVCAYTTMFAAGFQTLEQGASNMGTAAAGATANANADATAAFWNPSAGFNAGLEVGETKVDVGINVVLSVFDFNATSVTSVNPTLKPGKSGDAGCTSIVPNVFVLHRLTEDVMLTLSMTAPYALETDYDENWVGRQMALNSNLTTLEFNPSLAYRINKYITINGGISGQWLHANLTSMPDFVNEYAVSGQSFAVGGNGKIGVPDIEVFAKERRVRYDADEDEHYDTISAFIKSVRGCDPDAAMYWLAKMLVGGEDPRFIARRLLILASEDVGLADSRGILVANAAFDAVERVGQPECELNLAHATLFLATAPKSNSATNALFAAKAEVSKKPVQPVPLHLRDAHTSLNRKFGNGAEYIYNHDCPDFISGQDYLEKEVKLYNPTHYGSEKQIAERLEQFREIKRKIKNAAKSKR